MRRSIARLTVAAGLALSGGCRGATDPTPGGQAPILDALPRPLTSAERSVAGAANDFSFSLFRQLSAAQPDSNVFTSPLSASMALGMAMNGAAGATLDQMRSALAVGSTPESDVDAGYKGLIALLRGLDPGVDFRIANSIWYRSGFPVEPAFLDAGRNYFDAQVTALDFGSAASVKTINDWVSGATAGKIPAIVDAIDSGNVMFLIDAVYFKGSWRDRFDSAQTRDAPFHGIGGDQPMKLMHREGTIAYLSTPAFEAVDLPYGNAAFTMTVVLPRAGASVDAVAASLSGSDWTASMSQFHDQQVALDLPRFRLEWGRTLNGDLEALGMHDAFVPNGADFTRLSSRGRELFISEVRQKTFVDVNEEGTEAAAATSVGISATSAPLLIPMRVDRPFIIVIRERLSGTILFMGKIVRMP
ncbi:MAG: serpin family protein [Gemmatimonadales bacterium]